MSNLDYYKRALQEVQKCSSPIEHESRGYWFYIEDRSENLSDDDKINIYCDLYIEPILTIAWTEPNVHMARYIVALQNLSIPALRHIICLEDALMGLTTKEFKDKLIAELADDV